MRNIVLCVAIAASGIAGVNPVLAAVEDSQFEIAADRATIKFVVKDVSRREVLERLLAGTNVNLNWINTAFANEHISGTFSGAPAAVLRELLSQADFIIGYDENARLSRVIVVGRSRGAPSPAALAQIAAAIQQSGQAVNQPIAVRPNAPAAVQPGPAPARPAGTRVAQPGSLAAAMGTGSRPSGGTQTSPIAASAGQPLQLPAIPIGTGAGPAGIAPATPIGIGAAQENVVAIPIGTAAGQPITAAAIPIATGNGQAVSLPAIPIGMQAVQR